MSPAEFWRLHPIEFFWLWEAKQPGERDEWDELYEMFKRG